MKVNSELCTINQNYFALFSLYSISTLNSTYFLESVDYYGSLLLRTLLSIFHL